MNCKSKKNVLLHACCGPCLTYGYSLLSANYAITVYFCNPNITPRSEYNQRLSHVEKFAKVCSINLVVDEWHQLDWLRAVRPYRFDGELSQRCYTCYAFRLERAFSAAKHSRFDAVCTTLTVSPYKDASKINEIGKSLSLNYHIPYIEADFKTNGGYQQSIEMSKQYGMYRQNYCGCAYSKSERKKYMTMTVGKK